MSRVKPILAVAALAALAACSRSRQDVNPSDTAMGATTGMMAPPSTQPPVSASPPPGGAGGTPAPAPVGQGADTAIGRVAVVGPDPASWVALTQSGGAQLRLSGSAAETLRGVSGAQVWVSGARAAGGFRVNVFEVRRVNDQAVDDGVVVVAPGTGGVVSIRMKLGVQREVPNAPPAMREMPGARIWVSRPVAGVAPSFGVISRP